MQPARGVAAAAGPVGSPLWQRFTRQYQHLLSLSRRTRRALVRRWGLSLAGIALALTLGLAGPSAAAPPPGILVNGFSCGLADAITTANTDTATNGCIGYGYYDTIILQDNLVLSGLLPTITTDLTVDGQNAYYISGNDQFRIFTVAATGSLTVQNITLQNGYAPDNNINTPEGIDARRGGAIFTEGALTVTNSTIKDTRANIQGGAVHFYPHYSNPATLTITDSQFANNQSLASSGGAVYATNFTQLTITGSSTFTNNYANNIAVGGGPEIGLVFDGGSTTQYSVIGQDDDAGIVGTLGGSYTVPGAGVYASDLLAPLGDNSGPTFTMLPISPLLVDAVPSDNAFRADSCFGGLTTDQRGAVRPYDSTAVAGNGCDIGAVETQAPNAIELATLTANALPSGGVRIVWETASEIDSAGFNILRGRSADGSDRLAVNGSLIAATGSNGIGAEYTFDDTTAGVGTWYYWLEEIDTQGNATRHGPVSADVRVPTAVTLRNIGGSQGIGLVWGAISLVVATLVAFFRARRNDFSRFLRDGWKGRTTKVVTTNYAAPSVETVEMQDFASLLGAARAFSPRGWEDEL